MSRVHIAIPRNGMLSFIERQLNECVENYTYILGCDVAVPHTVVPDDLQIFAMLPTAIRPTNAIYRTVLVKGDPNMPYQHQQSDGNSLNLNTYEHKLHYCLTFDNIHQQFAKSMFHIFDQFWVHACFHTFSSFEILSLLCLFSSKCILPSVILVWVAYMSYAHLIASLYPKYSHPEDFFSKIKMNSKDKSNTICDMSTLKQSQVDADS